MRFISQDILLYLATSVLCVGTALAQFPQENAAMKSPGGEADPFSSAAIFSPPPSAGASWKASLFDPSVGAKAQGGTAGKSSDDWQYQITPYFFLISMKGTVGVNGREVAVDAPFRNIIDELNFGIMGAFEARKGKFVLLIDSQYTNLADSDATPGPLFSSAHADLKAFILDPEVGYRVAEKQGASLDAMAGIRYWHVSTRLDLRPGVLPATQVEGSLNWVDPVIGLRGKIPLSSRMFVTMKGDLGGFGLGSHFTWQLFGGLGTHLGKRASLLVGYRYLDVDYSSSGTLFDMALKGPVLGLAFRF